MITREKVEASAARNIARRPDLVNETHKRIVEEGGGVYEPGCFEGLVLFDSPQTGSTLAMPTALLTPEAVRKHIAESDERFGLKK